LSAASHLVVLVSGGEKAAILKELLTSEPDEVRYPIHALWPVLDKVTWLIDSEAARAL
jgi:6-phosphogluconolactonase/glucosamine-6-phosphate isomerase/deaminase